MNNLAIELPINDSSFGQLSVLLLKEMMKSGLEPSLFPIGNVGVSFEDINGNKEFAHYLTSCIKKGNSSYKIGDPVFRLWHLNGSIISPPNRYLMTFHELDRLTDEEKNIAANQNIISTTKYTQKVIGSGDYVPLGFDNYNFSEVDTKRLKGNKVHFLLAGKLEKRKSHLQTIRAWLKEFGNNPDVILHVAMHNSFLAQEQQDAILNQTIYDLPKGNINIIRGRIGSNAEYNQFLNMADVVIGMSGGEGWDLPVYHAMALGAHGVLLDAHAYQDYGTEKNAVLVKPSSKEFLEDGLFFQRGAPFNQGNIYTWEDENFIVACREAIKRAKKDRNKEGLKLQKRTYKEVLEDILKCIK